MRSRLDVTSGVEVHPLAKADALNPGRLGETNPGSSRRLKLRSWCGLYFDLDGDLLRYQ
jgi:hypothetical protein